VISDLLMLRRHCAEPRVMVGSLRRKAKPRRQSQTALSPTYSLGSSRTHSLSHNRTMLRKAPTRNAGLPLASAAALLACTQSTLPGPARSPISPQVKTVPSQKQCQSWHTLGSVNAQGGKMSHVRPASGAHAHCRSPTCVSTSPTGMYTEHIAWARTLTNQPSSKDSAKPEAVPISGIFYSGQQQQSR